MGNRPTIALVTGANKGIGLSVVKLLLSEGYYVYLGSRSEIRGLEAVRQLQVQGFSNVALMVVDVASQDSVFQTSLKYASFETHLDVLVNNAAIGGEQPQSTSSVNIKLLKDVLETNYFGAIRMTNAFLPFLKESNAPRIVNVSSELGSLAYHSLDKSGFYSQNLMAYSTSKVAMNSFTIMLANELQNTSFKINSVTPGFTKTDLTSHTGSQTPDEAARVILKYATLGDDGPSGQFFGGRNQIPW